MTQERKSSSAVRSDGWFILLIVAGVITYSLARYSPYTFLNFDCGWQALTAQSLVEDSDLDLKNQLGGVVSRAEDQIAIGVNGEWFCVHEALLPIMSAPFFSLFGFNGLLLFNWLMFIAAIFLFRKIALSTLGEYLGTLGALVFCYLSISFSYSFSIDLLGLTLALAALQVNPMHPALRGFITGMAVLGRISNVAILPGVWLQVLYSSKYSWRRNTVFFVTGGLLPLGAFLLQNKLMFGGFLDVSYFHNAYSIDGTLKELSQSRMLNSNLRIQLSKILFDREHGLLLISPTLTVLAVMGFTTIIRNRIIHPLLLSSVGLITLFSFYANAIDNGGGLRHHFLAVAPLVLCAVAGFRILFRLVNQGVNATFASTSRRETE